MRISKYFSERRILSRREAEKYILLGKVKVNGQIVKELGLQVDPSRDKIEIFGEVDKKTTLLFHKPRGISSSKVKSEGKNIFDLISKHKDLNAVGRLDKESEGLILLTNDGTLTNLITGKDHLIEKEYHVEVRERVTESKINSIKKGMMLNDGPTLPAKAKILSDNSFSIILKEGRNHQIRRMADKLKLTVLRLKRVRVGNITLGNLPVGEFREASESELQKIKSTFGAKSKVDASAL